MEKMATSNIALSINLLLADCGIAAIWYSSVTP